MTDPSSEKQTGSAEDGGSSSKFRKAGEFIVQNPIRAVQLAFYLLIVIIVLHNL